MWRFESVHRFGAVGNLSQKMHFAGSNPATDRKTPKCIYKNSKNIRVEKSGKISRNLPLSRFSSFGSKLTCHHERYRKERRIVELNTAIADIENEIELLETEENPKKQAKAPEKKLDENGNYLFDCKKAYTT